ncbi:hypothetical protein BJ138DRAFT_1120654 [Hygrophoropsis aurantiaca]|uniref:Uncharacterized protein n=1 Tax=Hygrophoropsis aurantiaca TaxID=72124 RepID=A0ACB7ZQ02_9AGAM|nr:hypothetical protein BJ138DRAFT_1120654 [Hygrophoropsis aurantiaca]
MVKNPGTQLTPAQKAAQTRAANKAAATSQLRAGVGTQEAEESLRPRRKAMDVALANQVWLPEKSSQPSQKRASSTVPESDKVKQSRTGRVQNVSQKIDVTPSGEDIHKVVPSKDKTAKTSKKTALTIATSNSVRHGKTAATEPLTDDEQDDELESMESHETDEDKELSDDSDDGLGQLARRPDLLKKQLQSEAPIFNTSNDHDSVVSGASGNSGKYVRSRHSSTTSMKSFASGPIGSESDSESDNDGSSLAPEESITQKVSRYRLPSATTDPRESTNSKSKADAKTSKPSRVKNRKRKMTLDLEKPEWGDVFEDAENSDRKPRPQQSHSKYPTEAYDCKQDWPESTHLCYSSNGKVNLKVQQPHIQVLLRGTISAVQKYLVFGNAYPLFDNKECLMRDLLLESARDNTMWKSQLQDIHTRIKADVEYVGDLASMPIGRVSSYRGNIEKIASRHIISAYALSKDSDQAIADLLEDNTFIFPVNGKGEPITNKPYQHLGILETIAEAFFDNDTCVGVKFRDHFTSTLDGNDEPELPAAMVALATTAVHAAFIEFKTNSGRRCHGKKGGTDFNSSVYSGIFKHHMDVLNAMFQKNPHFYHKMMASMYKYVS